MTQRIDFYQAEFRPVKVTLPLSRMVGILVATLFVLGVALSYQNWMLGKMQKEFATISALDKKQQAVVTQMTQGVSEMKVSPALEAQAQGMRASIANQERLLGILRKQSDTHKVSFSAYLQALMEHHQDGIALSRLRIEQAGTLMTLEGSAMEPALIPRYLDGLKQAEVLQGLGFSVFELQRSAGDVRVKFQVSSRGEDSESTPHEKAP